MEEIEDALQALLSAFNARAGRDIQLETAAVSLESAYLTFILREQSRSLTLHILDVVEPWGNMGLPEATAEIRDAMEGFWFEGNSEPARTVYIPPKPTRGVSD